jgi:hypothetical protein
LESNERYYRRRASEELAAASRAVTESARERRMMLAGIFLERLNGLDACQTAKLGLKDPDEAAVFNWANSAEHA